MVAPVRYHGLRIPVYFLAYLWHALIGATVLGTRFARWWGWGHGWQLESAAVAAGRPGHHDAMNAHKQGLATRARRSRIVAGCAAVAAAGALAMARFSPWWGWALFAVVLVLVLARCGRLPGERIVGAAIVPPEYERLTTDIITRALGSLSLSGIDRWLREGRQIAFISPVHRDGPGWRVELDLPYGVTTTEVIERREKLASGLRRPVTCVWPEPAADDHAGRLVLFVGDEPIVRPGRRRGRCCGPGG